MLTANGIAKPANRVKYMTLTMIGAKAAAALAIIGCLSFVGTYTNGLFSRFALSSELTAHIAESKTYRSTDKRETIEDSIREVEQEAEVLIAVPVLTSRERLRLKQLDNNKAMLIRRLELVDPR